MRVRVTAGAVLAALVGLAALLAPSAFAESTSSDYSSRLVTLINQARAEHGLRALTVAGGTSTVATNWAGHMAGQQALSHNPNLASQLESHGSPNWTTYAENVAAGSTDSADAMFQDYMNSPEHRANILTAAFRYVGVGTVFSGGFAWNTLDFVDQYSTSTSSTGTQTTTKTTTTKTTTTTTKAPSTTTKSTATRTTTATAPKTVTRSAPRTVTKAATRVVVVHHAATRPARTHAVVAHAAAHAPSVTVAAPAVAHVAAAPSPVALTTPLHDGNGRPSAPILAALLITMLVALRLGVAVFMRRR